MVCFRRSLLLVLGLLLIAVACGGIPNTGTSSASARAMTTQMKNTQRNQGTSQMPPAPAKTLIGTKQVQVQGRMVTALTTSNGMTLYEYALDQVPGSNCTGQCAQQWPPLLSNGTVLSTDPTNGTLTVHLTANGKQVEYNGHPLYTYSGDTAPGQTNGQAVGKVWQLVSVVRQQQHW